MSTRSNAFNIDLRTATVFKLIVSVLLAFIAMHLLATYYHINKDWCLAAGLFLAAGGAISGLLKHKTAGFYTIASAAGIILFANANNPYINISHNFAPPQTATIQGKVQQILKQTPINQRLIVEGAINAKHWPTLTNTKILLTINGAKQLAAGDIIFCNANISAPTNKTLPTDFNEQQYLHNYGASFKGWANEKQVTVYHAPSARSLINSMSYSIERKIDTIWTTSTAGFIKAILLANKAQLEPEVRRNFQIAGVAHILAVSGFHLGVIAAILSFVLSYLPINKWVRLLLFSIAIMAFGLVTNLQPPVVRAGWMAIIFMFSKAVQRQTNWLNIVSLVLLGTIIVSPELLYSVSFQLSLLSVLGIFLCYGIFDQFLQKVFDFCFKRIIGSSRFLAGTTDDGASDFLMHGNDSKNTFWLGDTAMRRKGEAGFATYLKNSLAVTLSASVVLTPLLVYYFNMFSLVSPLSNLLIIPLFSGALVFAVISIIFSFIYLPLGLYYAYNVEVLTDWCYRIAAFAADFQYSSISNIGVSLTVIFCALVLYIVCSRHKKQFAFRAIVSVFVSFLSFYLLAIPTHFPVPKLYTKYNYNLLSVPLADGSHFVWLADIKPHTNYYNDAGLIQYFNENNIKHVGINGNFGQNFAQKNLPIERCSVRQLSFAQQKELEKMFLGGKHMAQHRPTGRYN